MYYYIPLVFTGKLLGLYESIFMCFWTFFQKNYLMIDYFTFSKRLGRVYIIFNENKKGNQYNNMECFKFIKCPYLICRKQFRSTSA